MPSANEKEKIKTSPPPATPDQRTTLPFPFGPASKERNSNLDCPADISKAQINSLQFLSATEATVSQADQLRMCDNQKEWLNFSKSFFQSK